MELLFKNNLDNTKRRAPQCEGVARTGGRTAYGEAAPDRVKLISERDRATDEITRNGVIKSDRTIVVVDGVRDFVSFALSFAIEAAHDALEVGEFANHFS